MRREQRAEAGLARSEPLHVVCHESVQKFGGVGAGDLDDAAILKENGFCHACHAFPGRGGEWGALDFDMSLTQVSVKPSKAPRPRQCPYIARGAPSLQARRQPMTESFDTILAGGVLVNHDGEGLRDVGLRHGKIAEIGDLSRASAAERVDCTGLHILPGVVDTQVHFREPGATHKEDLETGSRAAVLGGVTAVFEMPNTKPLTTTAADLADKVARAKGRMHCDFAFYVGGTHENARDIPELERQPGAAGIKVFMGSSTGSLLVADDAGISEILSHTRRRAAFHAEDEERLKERANLRVTGDPTLASCLARRADGAARDAAASQDRAGEARAHSRAACFDGRRDGAARGPQGHRQRRDDAASSHLERRGLSCASGRSRR